MTTVHRILSLRGALLLTLMVEVGGVAYFVWSLVEFGYLPSPFLFDKADTFMDFFHTMYWADNDGRYTEWGSVYPPLIFLLLKLFKWLLIGEQGFPDAFALREGASFLWPWFCLAYIAIPASVVSFSYWRVFPVSDRLLFLVLGLMSMPMLFAFERGNSILLALIFLPWVISGKERTRQLALAVLVNLKPYFALLYLYYVARRQWGNLYAALIVAATLFAVTGMIVDSSFLMFLTNMFSFSQSGDVFSSRDVLSMPSSISAFSYVLGSFEFQQTPHMGALALATWIGPLIEAGKWCALGYLIFLVLMRGPQVPGQQLIAVLIVAITNLGVSVGGYSLLFYFAMLPVFGEMQFRKTYLFLIGIIAMPLDLVPIVEDMSPTLQFSYLSGSTTEVGWVLGLGSFLRPVCNFLLMILIAWELMWVTGQSCARDGNRFVILTSRRM